MCGKCSEMCNFLQDKFLLKSFASCNDIVSCWKMEHLQGKIQSAYLISGFSNFDYFCASFQYNLIFEKSFHAQIKKCLRWVK
jgi:hypothetical protein